MRLDDSRPESLKAAVTWKERQRFPSFRNSNLPHVPRWQFAQRRQNIITELSSPVRTLQQFPAAKIYRPLYKNYAKLQIIKSNTYFQLFCSKLLFFCSEFRLFTYLQMYVHPRSRPNKWTLTKPSKFRPFWIILFSEWLIRQNQLCSAFSTRCVTCQTGQNMDIFSTEYRLNKLVAGRVYCCVWNGGTHVIPHLYFNHQTRQQGDHLISSHQWVSRKRRQNLLILHDTQKVLCFFPG